MAWKDFATCACGKRGYPSRKAARRAARASSLTGVNAYQCKHPNANVSYSWHYGHLPGVVKRAKRSRRSLGPTAVRPRETWRGRAVE